LGAHKAFRSLFRHGDIERVATHERKALTSFAIGNSGWILPPQMSDRILSCLVDQTNVASLMGQETISAGSVIFPLDNVDFDQSAAWACEATCFPNLPHPDLSGLGQLEIKAETIRALVCAGSDMLSDASFNVEMWLTRRLARAFTNKISWAIVAGDGLGKPLGILNPQAGIPICDVGENTVAGTIDWRDLVQLKFMLPEQYQANGSYLMNGKTLGLCMTMSDAAARPILLPVPITQDGRVGSGYMIAGSPVHIVSQMPDCRPGSTPVAYGDWQQVYLVVTRKMTSLQTDPYSFGWCVGFKAEARIGGSVLCPNAARLLRVA
jgi:HK97 family phage major capsid protein